MNYLLKRLKQEYPFLRASDSTSFLIVNHNLAQTFKMLFKHRVGYPRFKSRRAIRQAYTEWMMNQYQELSKIQKENK